MLGGLRIFEIAVTGVFQGVCNRFRSVLGQLDTIGPDPYSEKDGSAFFA